MPNEAPGLWRDRSISATLTQRYSMVSPGGSGWRPRRCHIQHNYWWTCDASGMEKVVSGNPDKVNKCVGKTTRVLTMCRCVGLYCVRSFPLFLTKLI